MFHKILDNQMKFVLKKYNISVLNYVDNEQILLTKIKIFIQYTIFH